MARIYRTKVMELAKALQEQKQSGTRVGYNLVKLGFIQEIELTKILAKQHKMPAVDLSRFEADRKLTRMVPSDLAMHFTDDGPHHIETSTSDSRASAPVASTPQDSAERRIVAPITRTRFQGIPP